MVATSGGECQADSPANAFAIRAGVFYACVLLRISQRRLTNLLSPGANRRDFLKHSLTGTVLLGSAGFLSRCTGGRTGPAPGLMFFSSRELKTLTAFSQAVLPIAETSSAVQSVPSRIDREVSQWSARNQSQARSLLALVENGTRYFFFGWWPFSDLSVEERRRYLLEWESSTIDLRRQAYQALRMMAFFYYYSQDATWLAIDYDGPWIESSGH